MALRNYSSTVVPTKTACEIHQLLTSYGVRLRRGRQVRGDHVHGQDRGPQDLYFRLEPDPGGTLQALKSDPYVPTRYVTW